MSRARLGVVLLAVLLVGCAAPDAVNVTAPAAAPAAEVVAPAPGEQVCGRTPAARPAGPDLTPAALSVPAIGAQSSLIGLGVDANGGWVEPDVATPEQASWFTEGPMPGEVGPAVVLGHVNGGGRDGVFARLAQVPECAEVAVTAVDGTVSRFVVVGVEQVAKAEFPTERVFAAVDVPVLRLITCGGEFSTERDSYLGSVIAYAVAVA